MGQHSLVQHACSPPRYQAAVGVCLSLDPHAPHLHRPLAFYALMEGVAIAAGWVMKSFGFRIVQQG